MSSSPHPPFTYLSLHSIQRRACLLSPHFRVSLAFLRHREPLAPSAVNQRQWRGSWGWGRVPMSVSLDAAAGLGCTHARSPPPPPKWDMASHGGTGRRGGARSAGRGPKKRKVHEIAQVLCAIPFFKWIHFLIYLFTITLNHLLLWAKYRIASLCRPTQFINIVDNWIVQVICNCIVIYRQL